MSSDLRPERTAMLEVRARFGETQLACLELGLLPRWPSTIARAGVVVLGLGGLLLLAVGEPAAGGAALLLATALVVLARPARAYSTASPFELQRVGRGVELCWPATLEGEIEEVSGVSSLSALRGSGRVRVSGGRCSLPLGCLRSRAAEGLEVAPLQVRVGELRVEIAPASALEPLPRSRARNPERRAVLGWTLGSIAVHGLVVALALALPAPILPGPLGHRRALRRPALVAMPLAGGSSGGPLQLWLASGGESTSSAQIPSIDVRPRRSRRAAARRASGLYGLRGPIDNPDPHLARRLAAEAGRGAGILSLLRADPGPDLAGAFNTLGDPAGRVGNPIGEAYGVGGLGLTGVGRGGGGTGEGVVLGGAFGTLGRGGGGGGGEGYGAGVGIFATCAGVDDGCGSAPAGSVLSGRGEVRGSLDKEMIRRVVRRHVNEIRYCYEKELQSYPNGLEGQVKVRFEIAPDGRVLRSSLLSSTLGQRTIEGCVAAAPRRWLFPRSQGGVTVVSYPFYFRTPGGR